MIITIEGKLGSGKTYWAVNYILEKYYSWNNVINQYVPKYTDLRIVTNIDELDLPHENLKTLIEEKTMQGVFNENFVNTSAHCIFIIDESQYYFHRKYSDKEVFKFFQMSRHYGVDILLITQDVDTLSKELRSLSEYTIKALPRTRSANGLMRYSWLSENEQFRSQSIRFKKEVGSMYRSRMKEEKMKIPLTWKKYAIYAVALVLVSIIGIGLMVKKFYPDSSGSQNVVSRRPALRQADAGTTPEKAMTAYLARNPQSIPTSGSSDVVGSPRGKESAAEKETGFKKEVEIEREPLVPARCYEENDGWRVCFEGNKPIGRYQVHYDFKEVEKTKRGIVRTEDKYKGYEITVKN